MFNLVIEKEASEDCNLSGSSITLARIGTLTRFVRRFGFDFGL